MTVNITLNEISVKNGLEVLRLLENKETLPSAVQSAPEPKDIPAANATTNSFNPQAPATTVPTTNTYASVNSAAPTAHVAPVTPPMQYQQTAPVQTMQPNQAPVATPTSIPSYTIEQFQTAIAPLLDAGKVQQIQQLVQSFGVATLMDIPKERYGEFANGLRGLGGVL